MRAELILFIMLAIAMLVFLMALTYVTIWFAFAIALAAFFISGWIIISKVEKIK